MPSATNEFPMPANARPPAVPASEPTASTAPVGAQLAPGRNMFQFPGQEVVRLDPDLRPALEDMCQAAEGARWRERWTDWLSRMVSDALKNYLGQ